ncbi:DNA polymerase III subunit alpha [Camelimonas lactis]|uniref:DNA polymerase III subunit alpha n=1 Tax=Camelimonas lactis TaxID=659006 RepID=A0A4R2GM49_9HYPH|nr:DNA polymerase III subunit alpha [Camelimonas lactis]TCO10332.1 DNA polymerase-3 subunit alpha [Camelimonas lactis]
MSSILREVGFVHLHVHSSYSLLEGAMRVPTLEKLAKEDRQPAMALTDTNNLFGALEFSEKFSGSGIQPIAGLQLTVALEEDDPNARPALDRRLPSIVLLAATEAGYRNLLQLTSRAWLDAQPGEPVHVRLPFLADHAAGLIALTGGPNGPVDMALASGQADVAARRLGQLASIFDRRLYLELQRHGVDSERTVERELIRLAYDRGLPLAAANEPYFSSGGDYEAHDALLAIAEGRLVSDDRRRRLTQRHHFATRAEMQALFADIPEALTSTVEIAMRCSVRARTAKPMLPRFSMEMDEAEDLRQRAVNGLKARLDAHGPAEGLTLADYDRRLEYELSIIERMKFPGYFLIVSDFIQWAKAQDIPVGPGRGSGAGSLVAWALTITDLDPLRFQLLFERFLNPERVSMPDFDIDFCQDRRDEVISYVQRRYGEERVAQIITFGTLQARGVMRDVGRVFEMPYGQVDRLTKLVPQNPANPVTLAQAIADEPRLSEAAQEDPVVGQMLTVAQKLEGLHRHASTHAAGIVIGDRPLEQLVPLYKDPKSGMRVTQFNMKWVEQAGLVKFDFLGLKTLTVLRTAVNLLAQRGVQVDLSAIPLDDRKTYELLGRGETVGVFQVESVGMRKALVDMRADRLEDLIALVALYRPGPMANIPVYCERKHGKGEPEEQWYLHPKLAPILRETFGIIVYQEQVMQVAQELSGYSLGEADLLRRAMGKKIKAEMDAQRVRFVDGAEEADIPKALADEIFDLLARFADYGFNKSHAAAYALVAYQTAYLKANYPVEFLAALMALDMDNTDKLSEFRRDAERLGARVEPPSINRSGVTFEVEHRADVSIIRYALAAVKGVGVQAVEAIVAARGDRPFRDLADFASRLQPRLVNKRTIEALIAAGAFDELEKDRARATAAIEAMIAMANRTQEAAAIGQNDFFGGAGSAPEPLRIPDYDPWLPAFRLQKEYDAIGFFLTGHPLDEYGALLEKLRVQRWTQFVRSVKAGSGVGRVAATVLDRQERRTKSGSKMGIINFSDQSGQFEAIIFSEGLSHYRELLEPGRPLVLILQASLEGEEVRARIQSVEPLDAAVARHQKGLRIFLRDERPVASIAQRLRERGESEVSLILMLEESGREVEVKLKGRYLASPQVASALRAISGVVDVQMMS